MDHSAAIQIPPKQAEDSGVDVSSDLSPHSPVDRKRMDSLLANRPPASDLQDKGILKGAPNDALAARKMSLEKSMTQDRLEQGLSKRPTAEVLVSKGILNAEPGSM